jgi:hypothetical protein
MTRAGVVTAEAPRAANRLRPDRVAREPAPEAKAAVEDALPQGKASPLAAPRAATGPQQRGPLAQRRGDDDDDFGDTDVTSLLG